VIMYTWVLIIVLFFLFIGYAAGRRTGIRMGREKGFSESKLRLREESYRAGICPICDRGREDPCKR
jgi:hypothetical protein